MSLAPDRSKPLVAAICDVPLLSEAVGAAVGDVMTVLALPAGGGDTAGLLGWLRPDGVVVDGEREAIQAAPFASERNLPLVHVSLADRRLRVLRAGQWEEAPDVLASAASIRNILVGGIFGKGRAE